MDNHQAAKDEYGRECSPAGYSQDDFEEVQGQVAGRQDTSRNQQSETKCVPERDCRCMRNKKEPDISPCPAHVRHYYNVILYTIVNQCIIM